MRCWSQDLTLNQAGQPETWGGKARHGRGTVWFTDSDVRPERSLHGEWVFFSDSHTGISVRYESSDGDWHFHVAVKRLFGLWLQTKNLLPRWPKPIENYEGRQLSVDVHDDAVFWNVWRDPMSWSSKDGWRQAAWHWKDALLGKAVRFSEIVVDEPCVSVPMPEGNYPVSITIEQCRDVRPRTLFGWGERIWCVAKVEMLDTPDYTPGRIPCPGKWDDDDGIFSMSTGLDRPTVSEAVAKVVQSVLRNRERRGSGLSWVPPKLRPAEP